MSDTRWAVDLDELDLLVSDLARCEDAVEQLTRRLAHEVAALQEHWQGLAASAQAEAHAEWEHGERAMRHALARLRDVVATARHNYAAAGEATVALWGRAR